MRIRILIFSLLSLLIFMFIPTLGYAQGPTVTHRLPFGPEAGLVRISRTGLLYKSIYEQAGLPTKDAPNCDTSSYCNGPNGEYHDYGDGFSFVRGAIDFAMPTGTRVLASADGVVANTTGCSVFINHADGAQSFYHHLSAVRVRPNQNVTQGTPIGLSGNTCDSHGPHLHYALWQGGVEILASFTDASVSSHDGYVRPSRTGFQEYRYTADEGNIPDPNPIPIPEFSFQYISQEVPDATMDVGETFTLKFTLKNIGTETWRRGAVKVGAITPGANPPDRNSAFYQDGASGWESASRIHLVENEVTPGNIGTFEAILTAPDAINQTFREHFSVVAEGIQWLSGPDLWFEVSITDVINPLPPGQRGEDYKYEGEPNQYVCGDIVALRADPNGSQPEIDFDIRKCDGSAFQQDGTAKLVTINGQIIAEKSYQAGIEVISFEAMNPYDSHDLIGRSTYVVEIYSADDPNNAKLTGAVQAFVEPNPNPTPPSTPYEYNPSVTQGECGSSGLIKLTVIPTPNQPVMTVVISKCDDTPFVQDGEVVLMVNGMVLDSKSYSANGTEIRFENLDPNGIYNLLGRNSYQAQVYSSDDPQNAKLSGIVEAWPKPVERPLPIDSISYSIIEDNVCGPNGIVKLDADASGTMVSFGLKKCDDTSFQQDGVAYLLVNDLVIAHQAYNAGVSSVDFSNLDPFGQYDIAEEANYQVQLFSADDPVRAKLTGVTKVNAEII